LGAGGPEWRGGLAAPPALAYIRPVFLTRRQTRAVLRTVIPLLALVWASLPLHHCNLAFAGPAHGAQPALAAAPAPHCHQVAPSAPPPSHAVVSCSDLGRAGPDLRPAPVIDAGPFLVSSDARWQRRDPGPAARSAAVRPLDDGRWRLRPLHLQKSSLLI
jgi:hypothetical protein